MTENIFDEIDPERLRDWENALKDVLNHINVHGELDKEIFTELTFKLLVTSYNLRECKDEGDGE